MFLHRFVFKRSAKLHQNSWQILQFVFRTLRASATPPGSKLHRGPQVPYVSAGVQERAAAAFRSMNRFPIADGLLGAPKEAKEIKK